MSNQDGLVAPEDVTDAFCKGVAALPSLTQEINLRKRTPGEIAAYFDGARSAIRSVEALGLVEARRILNFAESVPPTRAGRRAGET